MPVRDGKLTLCTALPCVWVRNDNRLTFGPPNSPGDLKRGLWDPNVSIRLVKLISYFGRRGIQRTSRKGTLKLLGAALFRFAVLGGAISSGFAEPSSQPSTAESSSPTNIVNPNATPVSAQPQPPPIAFDVKKLAAMTRPAVALVTVYDKSDKPLKVGTGFFVSSDGKLVTNSHVIEGAANATAKLENGATYSIRGVLKPAPTKICCCSKQTQKTYRFLRSVSKRFQTLDREWP